MLVDKTRNVVTLFLNKAYLDKLTNSRTFPQKLSSSQNVLRKDQLSKLRILKQLNVLLKCIRFLSKIFQRTVVFIMFLTIIFCNVQIFSHKVCGLKLGLLG